MPYQSGWIDEQGRAGLAGGGALPVPHDGKSHDATRESRGSPSAGPLAVLPDLAIAFGVARFLLGMLGSVVRAGVVPSFTLILKLLQPGFIQALLSIPRFGCLVP